jgi:hypothetical protein
MERVGAVAMNLTNPFASAIIRDMGGIDLDESLIFFDLHGGYYDCEILFNVDMPANAADEGTESGPCKGSILGVKTSITDSEKREARAGE